MSGCQPGHINLIRKGVRTLSKYPLQGLMKSTIKNLNTMIQGLETGIMGDGKLG